MTGVCLCTRPRVRLCLVALAFGLWLSVPAPAFADPSAVCRDLAARFATAATELDLQALAGLMTCISAEMQDRAGGPIVVPPSGVPAPPPSPSSARQSGGWPSSQWPPSPSWDSTWPPVGPDVR